MSDIVFSEFSEHLKLNFRVSILQDELQLSLKSEKNLRVNDPKERHPVFSSVAKLRNIPTNPSLQPVIYAMFPSLRPPSKSKFKGEPKTNCEDNNLDAMRSTR